MVFAAEMGQWLAACEGNQKSGSGAEACRPKVSGSIPGDWQAAEEERSEQELPGKGGKGAGSKAASAQLPALHRAGRGAPAPAPAPSAVAQRECLCHPSYSKRDFAHWGAGSDEKREQQVMVVVTPWSKCNSSSSSRGCSLVRGGTWGAGWVAWETGNEASRVLPAIRPIAGPQSPWGTPHPRWPCL